MKEFKQTLGYLVSILWSLVKGMTCVCVYVFVCVCVRVCVLSRGHCSLTEKVSPLCRSIEEISLRSQGQKSYGSLDNWLIFIFRTLLIT